MALPQVVGYMSGESLGFGLPIFAFDFPPERVARRHEIRRRGAWSIMQQNAVADPPAVVAERVRGLQISRTYVVCCAGELPADFC